MVASVGCSLFLVGFLSRKPLSQIQGSTLLLIQEASHTRPFGGLGFKKLSMPQALEVVQRFLQADRLDALVP